MTTKNGGGGSSLKNSMTGSMGPIKIILIGNRIVDTVLFHPICASVPSQDSPFGGKRWGPDDPKSVLEIKRKANAEMRKKITNLFLEVFIYLNYIAFFIFLKEWCDQEFFVGF